MSSCPVINRDVCLAVAGVSHAVCYASRYTPSAVIEVEDEEVGRVYSHACHHLRLKVVAYRRQMELDTEQLLAQSVE